MNVVAACCEVDRRCTASENLKKYKRVRQALRYALLFPLTDDCRHGPCLTVWQTAFCFSGLPILMGVDGIRPVSKSTIERYEKLFSRKQIEQLIHACNTAI